MEIDESLDKRRDRRWPIELQLEIDEFFKQDYISVSNIRILILVSNISKGGIGFVSEADLPIGFYFRSTINLTDKDFFRAVLQIVRTKECEGDQKVYGAKFVGLAPFLADKVDYYEKSLND